MSKIATAPIWRSILACVLASLALGATAADGVTATEPAAQTDTQEQDVSADQGDASPSVLIIERVPVHRPALEVLPDELADQQIICTWEAPVGSRLLRKRCVTEEHRRIVAQQWREWLRQVQMAFVYN